MLRMSARTKHNAQQCLVALPGDNLVGFGIVRISTPSIGPLLYYCYSDG